MKGSTLCSAAMALALTTMPTLVQAADTSYDDMTELKAFRGNHQVSLKGQKNSCDNKKQYNLDPSEDGMYRLLISAFLSGHKVMLSYTCDGSRPYITAVRLKK